MPTLRPLRDSRLYTFVDTAYLASRSPESLTRALCDGGADLVQLRAKDLPPHEVRRLGERLLPITAAAGVWLVINDHPSVAADIGAPLCHLGQEDFFETGRSHVSQIFDPPQPHSPPGSPPSPLPQVGLSSHAPDQAARAVAAGAAYVAVGPVFATPTKPGRTPVTLDYVRWAAAHLHLPWFAIGGISLDNLQPVLAAGAQRICVVRALLQAPDVTAACRTFRRHLDSIGGPGTRDQGPGTRDQGPGTRDQGPGTRDQGPGTKDQGPGTAD